nr:DNA polymerase I family protein [Actinomycetota bacterium]
MEERTSSYTLVTDVEELVRVAASLKEADFIGLDIETTGLNPRNGGLRLIQLATPEATFVVDAFETGGLIPLKAVLEDGPVKIGHNLKFDYAFLWAEHGISLSPIFDTMLATQLLDGGEYASSYALEAVARRYLDEEVDKSERRADWSGDLSERQLEYAARDAAILLPLQEALREELEKDGLVPVSCIEFDAVAAISEMELAGIKLDVAKWKELEKTVR